MSCVFFLKSNVIQTSSILCFTVQTNPIQILLFNPMVAVTCSAVAKQKQPSPSQNMIASGVARISKRKFKKKKETVDQRISSDATMVSEETTVSSTSSMFRPFSLPE